MQTLERTQELADLDSSGGPPNRSRRPRSWLIVAGVSAVLLVTAGIAYAVGTSQSSKHDRREDRVGAREPRLLEPRPSRA